MIFKLLPVRFLKVYGISQTSYSAAPQTPYLGRSRDTAAYFPRVYTRPNKSESKYLISRGKQLRKATHCNLYKRLKLSKLHGSDTSSIRYKKLIITISHQNVPTQHHLASCYGFEKEMKMII